jgi:hypothetical protein
MLRPFAIWSRSPVRGPNAVGSLMSLDAAGGSSGEAILVYSRGRLRLCRFGAGRGSGFSAASGQQQKQEAYEATGGSVAPAFPHKAVTLTGLMAHPFSPSDHVLNAPGGSSHGGMNELWELTSKFGRKLGCFAAFLQHRPYSLVLGLVQLLQFCFDRLPEGAPFVCRHAGRGFAGLLVRVLCSGRRLHRVHLARFWTVQLPFVMQGSQFLAQGTPRPRQLKHLARGPGKARSNCRQLAQQLQGVPPRQKPASFNLVQVKREMSEVKE